MVLQVKVLLGITKLPFAGLPLLSQGLARAGLDNKEAFGGQFPEAVPDKGGVQDSGIVPGGPGELHQMG